MPFKIYTYEDPYKLDKADFWSEISALPHFCSARTLVNGLKDVLGDSTTITATRKQRPSSARASASAPKSWRRSKHSSAVFRRTSCGRRCALPTGWITGMKRTASRISAPRRSPAMKTASACTSSRSWARFR